MDWQETTVDGLVALSTYAAAAGLALACNPTRYRRLGSAIYPSILVSCPMRRTGCKWFGLYDVFQPALLYGLQDE